MNISSVNVLTETEALCRSYVCVTFEALELQIQSGTVHVMALVWAAGILSDHRPHYLGAWLVPAPKDAGWRAIASNLHDRGVERLRIVIGPDPMEIEAAMAPRFRFSTVLPASSTHAYRSLHSTLPGHRQYVDRAMEVSHSVGQRLKRVAARHGPFPSAAAAAALLRRSAERCIALEWPEPIEPVRAPRSAAATPMTAAVN